MENSTPVRDQSGVALFMVVSAMMILSLLVTEFVYVAQVNQRMAFDSLDQLQAHYLAKSGFKLSLLRLKAYQNLRGVLGGAEGGAAGGAGGGMGIPKSLLEKIWSFPFMYPIPTQIPGMSLADKSRIEEFQKASGLAGRFTAIVESESSKYNLNSILAPFVAQASPSPTPTPTPTPTPGGGQTAQPNPAPAPTPTFDPEAARQSLADYLGQTLNQKIESDQDFAAEYRDLRLEDLLDGIIAWADRSYERRLNRGGREDIPMKQAPFYSLSELHMIPPMDDTLYDLFAPTLTVSTTPGINVNTMKEHTFRALVPGMNKEEVAEFFKFRDSEEDDNQFKADEDFFKYLKEKISVFHNDADEIRRYQENLTKRNIRIVTQESEFKITVQASVNTATRVLEAWVTLYDPKDGGAKTSPKKDNVANAPPPSGVPPLSGPGMIEGQPVPDSGLKVTFMRFL